MRTFPARTYPHSASLCQCSSRTPPSVSRMFTPASDRATGNSRAVTSRAQPPSSSRLRACEKENFRFGIVPLSVSGDARLSGFCRSSSILRGPRLSAPRRLRTGCGTEDEAITNLPSRWSTSYRWLHSNQTLILEGLISPIASSRSRRKAGRAHYAWSGNSVADRGLRLGAPVGRELNLLADQRKAHAKQ